MVFQCCLEEFEVKRYYKLFYHPLLADGTENKVNILIKTTNYRIIATFLFLTLEAELIAVPMMDSNYTKTYITNIKRGVRLLKRVRNISIKQR